MQKDKQKRKGNIWTPTTGAFTGRQWRAGETVW